MNKINILIICMLSLAIIPMVYGANVGTVLRVYPNITLISQEPDPVEPGDVVNLRFKIDNRGGVDGTNFQIQLIKDYPFSMYSGNALRNLGTLYGRQKGNKGIIEFFKVRVDENAEEGDNDIYLQYKHDDSEWTKLNIFKIRVRASSAVLTVTEVKSIPKSIPPGKEAEVNIKIKNLAGVVLKDVRLELGLDDVPLAPLGSTNEKIIEKINPKKTEIVVFKLISLPRAESNIYKIPLRIRYIDDSGKNYSKTNIISLIIGDIPDVYAIIDSATLFKPNTKIDVSIKFTNKGNSEIKFLDAKLAKSPDYDIISADQSYVGNIDSDDYESADFTLFIKSDKKEIPLLLTMQYQDSNNKNHIEKLDLKLKVYSASEIKKLGAQESNNKVGIIIVVIIVVAGIFIYRWKKKKKRDKK